MKPSNSILEAMSNYYYGLGCLQALQGVSDCDILNLQIAIDVLNGASYPDYNTSWADGYLTTYKKLGVR